MATTPNARQVDDAIVVTGSAPTAGQLPVATGTGNETAWTDPDAAVLDNVDSITFDTAAGVSVSEGEIAWNSTDKTLDMGTGSGGVVIQMGQEFLLRARNQSGVTLVDGDAVYITGAQGNRPTIQKTQANLVTADSTIGVVTQTISNNTEGFVTIQGLVRNLDTSTFTEGDTLWLSESVLGGITNVKPASPDNAVIVGVVVRQHASAGIIFVRILKEEQLSDLHDVSISGLSDGDILSYDSGSSTWANISQPVASVTGDTNITIAGTPNNPQVTLDSVQTFTNFSLNTTDVSGTPNIIAANSQGVVDWNHDGVNTSVSLQHNGSDRLIVDESGVVINSVDGFIATTNGVSGGRGITVDSFGSIVLRALGGEALQFENDANENPMSLGTNGTAGTDRNGVIKTVSGTNHVGLFIRSVDNTRRVIVGAGGSDAIENLSASQIGLEVVDDGSNNANVAFFGATPVAQQSIDSSDTDANRIAALEAALEAYGLVVDTAP